LAKNRAAPIKRKALLNSLAGCSAGLKKQVTKRNVLSRSKLPVGVSELRKLILAAKVSCNPLDAAVVKDAHQRRGIFHLPVAGKYLCST
jgi:hypothetical protein